MQKDDILPTFGYTSKKLQLSFVPIGLPLTKIFESQSMKEKQPTMLEVYAVKMCTYLVE